MFWLASLKYIQWHISQLIEITYYPVSLLNKKIAEFVQNTLNKEQRDGKGKTVERKWARGLNSRFALALTELPS